MRVLSSALFCALWFASTVLAEGPNLPTQDSSAAETIGGLPETQVKVCIDLAAAVRFERLAGAERTAVQLFEGIGVRLRFVCERSPEASSREIVMRLADRTDPDLLKGALGFARPYAREGVRVTIFYDRVELIERGRDDMGIILGHIMTHELTHVLEAEDNHADTGIMRSRWDKRDFEEMRLRELYFSEEDVRAIHSNISAFLRP